MSDDLVKRLRDMSNYYNSGGRFVAADRIEELEAENEKLRKGLEIYERERIRFKHAKPEMTGEFFIAGYHGSKNDNMLPQYIEICPAYGCAWVQVYERSHKTISYEGS